MTSVTPVDASEGYGYGFRYTITCQLMLMFPAETRLSKPTRVMVTGDWISVVWFVTPAHMPSIEQRSWQKAEPVYIPHGLFASQPVARAGSGCEPEKGFERRGGSFA